MACPNNTTCTTAVFASTIQTANRSSADYTSFVSGRALFSYTNNTSATYQQIGLPPRFNSHTDYIRYQRMITQMNATPTR